MARRADTYLGAAAALVAVGGIAVFGYRTLAGEDDHPSGGGGRHSTPSALTGADVPRRGQLVDQDYRFQLTAPGPEWEVFDRADADPIWFGQIAAMEGERALLQVSMERAGDITLDAAADRIAGWLASPIAERKMIRWLDRDVIELRVDASAGAEDRRERVFVRDGLLHDISLVRSAGVPWDQLEVEPLWDSFALLDGTPHAVTPKFPPRDKLGVGWRVNGDTWESAVVGITATAPPGWRMMTGRAITSPATDVELANDACGCYVMLSTFVAPATIDPKARTMSIDALGGSYQAVAAAGDANDVYQVWDTTIMLDNRIRIQLEGWYPRADATTGIIELRRAFAAFAFMTADAQAALARALERPRFDRSDVGPTWALRNGTYVDYQWGVVWKQPPGFWRISTGARANELLPGAILVATEPRLRIVMFVVPDDAVTEPAHSPAKWAADNIGGKIVSVPGNPRVPALGDWFEGTWVDDVGATHVHRVAPMIGPAHSFRVHLSGVTDAMLANAAEAEAAVAGLEVRTVEARTEAGLFVDRRWGYSVDLPGWVRTDRGDTGTSADSYWELGQDQMIAVIAESARGGPQDRFTQMRGRLSASAAVGQGTAPRPRESAGVLAGEDAVKLVWWEGATLVTVMIAEHDHLLYTVFTRGTEATFETARRVFKFVPLPD